eukprot:5363075-Pyramimonas_sp.AAC.2
MRSPCKIQNGYARFNHASICDIGRHDPMRFDATKKDSEREASGPGDECKFQEPSAYNAMPLFAKKN